MAVLPKGHKSHHTRKEGSSEDIDPMMEVIVLMLIAIELVCGLKAAVFSHVPFPIR